VRTIKFRAWDSLGKKMLPSVGITEDGAAWASAIYASLWIVDSLYPHLNLDNFESENFKVMQFVGFKDIFYVDVYEGDICEDINGRRWEIIYSDKEAMFLGRDEHGITHTLTALSPMRVVSNIFRDSDENGAKI
jgi:hypothetical protein